jgi:biopolymer transport protein ExbD
MLDILVILVFYLIKTYSSSVTSIVVPEDISVPTSLSTNITNDALTIQISKDKKIWVEDKLVLQMSNENSLKLDPLFDELIRLEHRYQMIDKQVDGKNQKTFDKPINLIMDKG